MILQAILQAILQQGVASIRYIQPRFVVDLIAPARIDMVAECKNPQERRSIRLFPGDFCEHPRQDSNLRPAA